MAQQIRELDAAAARTADRISAASEQLKSESGGGPRAQLTAGIADALVGRTDEIRNDCERLSGLMQRATAGVARREAEGGPSVAPPVTRDLRTVESPVAPAAPPVPAAPEAAEETEQDTLGRSWDDEAEPQRSGSEGSSEGVRLIATQMAIAGSSRAEIERRLRNQFGVADAGQALDDIFGASRSGAR